VRCVERGWSKLAAWFAATVITLAVIVALALAALGGYALGRKRAAAPPPASPSSTATAVPSLPAAAGATVSMGAPIATVQATASQTADDIERERVGAEKARIIRSRDTEAAMLRADLADRDAWRREAAELRREREQLSHDLGQSRGETARYRQLVINIENRAPPPILAGVGEPDDLKLIVGIGPVLERMLHGLGITQFRQIARWTERDASEFDAKLPEFPGRIQRDQWVTQARELHQSKFGERL